MGDNLEILFNRALELDPADREAYLEEACRGDRGLRKRLESLLRADSEAEEFLQPALASGGEDPLIGSRVGSYRVDRRIGSGGMSNVYLAHRDDGSFEKEVALKFLRAGFYTEPFLKRFAVERQVLARLQHPNIAQLIDGGVTERGHPYLVMEFVNGEPLDAYAAREKLEVEDRLELFLVVCDAVQFAHRNLIVHRDLKPSNILVDGSGSVQLLDFGIAKVLETEGESENTITRERMLTPRYASPEQIQGSVVTTASDSYSLGVLLFELLTGRSPYAVETTSPTEMERAVITSPPIKPSKAVADAQSIGSLTPERLARRLSGDLDVILLTALRKEPDRRYESVDRLADDVRRHLNGLPVSARPDTFGYRMSKFVRRNKAVVALSAALGILLTGAFLVSSILLFQARQARDMARDALAEAQVQRSTAQEVSAFLEGMFAAIDPGVRQSKEPVTVQELLDDAVLRIDEDLGGRPLVAASLYRTVGVTRRQMAEYEEAEQNLSRALAYLEDQPPGPDRVQILIDLGQTYTWAGQYDRSVETLNRALHEVDSLDPVPLNLKATALRVLGDAHAQRGDYEAALQELTEAVSLRRASPDSHKESLAQDLGNLGMLTMRRGDNANAEPLLTESLELFIEAKGLNHTQVAVARSSLGYLLMDEARYTEAAEHLEKAVDRLSAVYPDDHPSLLQARGNLARCYQQAGDYDRAEAIAVETIEAFESIHGHDHQNVGHAVHNLGFFVLERGDADRAADLFAEATSIYQTSLGPEHPYVAVAMFNHSRALRAAGDLPEAERVCLNSLEIRRSALRENHPDIARSCVLMGDMLLSREAYAEAEPYLREGTINRRVSRGPRHPDTAWSEMLWGACLTHLGRTDEAVPLLERSVAVIDSAEGADSDRTRRARMYLAEARGESP